MRRTFAYATILSVSVVAPAAAQKGDEEAIKRFDYHHDTVKQNLDKADDERVVGLARDLESRLKNCRAALDSMKNVDHPEVVKRRDALAALEAELQRRKAAALAGIGKNERGYIKQSDDYLARGKKELDDTVAKDETLLRGDRAAPDALPDDDLKRAKESLDRIRQEARQHPEVVAALERIATLEQAVAQRRDACLAKLKELGDVGKTSDDHVKWIRKNERQLLPAPPAPTPAAWKAFAATLKTAVAELQARVDYLEAIQRWDPVWPENVDLRNKVKYALQLARNALAQPTAAIDRSVGPSSFDPEKVSKDDLRRAAIWGTGNDHHGKELSSAVFRAMCVCAFHEAWAGAKSPQAEALKAGLVQKKQRYEQRVAEQVASERLPEPGEAQRRHGEDAHGCFPRAVAIGLDGDVELSEGVEEEKTEVGRRDIGGGMVEIEYRITKHPYKADVCWGYAVFEEEGKLVAYRIKVAYNHIRYKDDPLREWYQDGEKDRQFVMLRENLLPAHLEAAAGGSGGSPSRPTGAKPAKPDAKEPDAQEPSSAGGEQVGVAGEEVGRVDEPSGSPEPDEEAVAPRKSGGGAGRVIFALMGLACCFVVTVGGAGGGYFLYSRQAAAAAAAAKAGPAAPPATPPSPPAPPGA